MQLRQHALDRALQPDVVQALSRHNPTSENIASRVVATAKAFEDYLRGPDKAATPEAGERPPGWVPAQQAENVRAVEG
jgi:hypothetical protein